MNTIDWQSKIAYAYERARATKRAYLISGIGLVWGDLEDNRKNMIEKEDTGGLRFVVRPNGKILEVRP